MVIAASVVVLDDVLECAQAAVVHVRRRPADLAQGRCLERASVGLERGHGGTSFIVKTTVTPGNARVVKAFVAESGAHVAGRAVALAPEHLRWLSLGSPPTRGGSRRVRAA